ncbi:hypothetical protein DXG01_014799 [Tephrocybe rancida]|nr:hypothetical protein DXG01_014799 [Tephrocybe rancida]
MEAMRIAGEVNSRHDADVPGSRFTGLTRNVDQVKCHLDLPGREIFVLLDSPREKEIRDLIQSSGGAKASISNDKVLQTLVDKSGEKQVWVSGHGNENPQKLKKSLLGELSEDIEKALEQHMVFFHGKLDIQLREIASSIKIQADRMMAFLSGGHEQVIDVHVREMWREMGWKSTVKARHFVLALRDFYLSKRHTSNNTPKTSVSHAQQQQLPSPTLTPASSLGESTHMSSIDSDAWVTAYVNISYLQAISEAIDDDGSGFVNIKEINDFTTLRPQGWTVPQWVAYWAAGEDGRRLRGEDELIKYLDI